MGINGVTPFNVQIFEKKGLGDIILGTKPLWARYQSSNGQVKEIAIKPQQLPYFTAFNGRSTAEKPNLTSKDIFDIKVNITKQTKGSKNVPVQNLSKTGTDFVLSKDSVERQDFFGLLDLYSDASSDSGKEITPKEQADIIDTYTQWYKE